MKHKHEEYTKFLEQYIEALTDKDTGEVFLKSLVANEATLERHEPIPLMGGSLLPEFQCANGCGNFPCPTLLGVTDQLDLVMGVSND